MSYYYKYQFTSPEGVFAIIKEELKSYYDTGAVDDIMFATYLNKALRKLGKATYSILEDVLYIEDFESRLPDNFNAVREAWLCTQIDGPTYQSPGSFYSQAGSSTTIQIAPITINGEPCGSTECNGTCEQCMPTVTQAVYKTNNAITQTYIREYLLKPGNISARNNCSVGYMDNWEAFIQSNTNRQFTPHSSTYGSFDIRDNKFVVNFRTGIVNLVFYGVEYDNLENQMIPDNYRIMEYLEAFIKYKIFETLLNQTNDETYNQLEKKLVYYKQLSDEAFIMANTELMKQTPWDKQRRIKESLNRHQRYELPVRSYRGAWRRNS